MSQAGAALLRELADLLGRTAGWPEAVIGTHDTRGTTVHPSIECDSGHDISDGADLRMVPLKAARRIAAARSGNPGRLQRRDATTRERARRQHGEADRAAQRRRTVVIHQGLRYTDTPTVEVETFIAAPPARVWELVADLSS